jgi:hypothetical protein
VWKEIGDWGSETRALFCSARSQKGGGAEGDRQTRSLEKTRPRRLRRPPRLFSVGTVDTAGGRLPLIPFTLRNG